MSRYSANPEGVRLTQQPFQGYPSAITHLIPGLPKLNPGLKLANTFGVKSCRENEKLSVCSKEEKHVQIHTSCEN